VTGNKLEFALFDDKDLPFMNVKSEMGEIMRTAIIDGDVDDDC
jgi:hypothetical protein